MTARKKSSIKSSNELKDELRRMLNSRECEVEKLDGGVIYKIKASKAGISGAKRDNITQLNKFLSDNGFLLDDLKETAKSVAMKLTPTMRDNFKTHAEQAGLPFTEFMRRAAIAAQLNPETLFSEEVEKKEQEYKASLKSSRWSKTNLKNDPPS